ncbi:MAG: hypothetical protein ACRDSN_06085, partial [Pseudonocardiaceae bacterium]
MTNEPEESLPAAEADAETPFEGESDGPPVAEAPDDATPAGESAADASPAENGGGSYPAGLTPPSLTGAGRRFLSDLIVELGFVDAETVAGAVESARRPGLTVEKVLLEQGILSEDQLARALAERYGLDHIDPAVYPIDRSAAGLLQEGPARRYRAVPVGFSGDGSLIVAVADPSDSLGLSDIAVMTKLAVRPAVVARSQVDELIETLEFMEEHTRPAAQSFGAVIIPPEEGDEPAAAPVAMTPPPAPVVVADGAASARFGELEAELTEARKRLAGELAAERELRSREVEEARARYTQELEEARGRYAQELEAERERHLAELEELRGRHAQELDAERGRLAAELEAQRDRHAGELETERGRLTGELEGERRRL